VSLRGGTVYVTKFPCVACASAIVQATIGRVYTEDPEAWKSDPYDFGDGRVTKKIFQESGVIFHQVKQKGSTG
jgi:deoxycytidylate deaminase